MKRLAFLLLVIFSTWSYVHAAGGPDIVDDAQVETPGVCHFEAWVSRFDPGDGYFNLSPACTLKQLPFVEFGLPLQHYWDQNIDGPVLGPSVKINLRSEDTGLGIGTKFSSGVNLRTGDVETAFALLLVTVPIDDKVRINLNAGWNYVQGDRPDALFYGAQVEAKVGWDLRLMIEAFGRAPGEAGVQMGLRYRPNDGPIDFNLLAGSILDSERARFFTFGVTIRY